MSSWGDETYTEDRLRNTMRRGMIMYAVVHSEVSGNSEKIWDDVIVGLSHQRKFHEGGEI